MISVKRRGNIHQDTVQTMGTLSQTFHLKTSSICSLEEVTRQVSVTFFVVVVFIPGSADYNLYVNRCICCINLGNANVYANGRMRHQRRERRERQRDVSLVLLLELLQTADMQIV